MSIQRSVSLKRLVMTVLAALAFCAVAEQGEGYLLGAGDLINIQVFGEEDLSLETRLGNDGLIAYPFLGDLALRGLTVKEVEKLLHGGLLGDYLVNPSVHVSIKEYRPFFIDGEVRKPGGYPYQPGLTVGKAIALAQGLTQRASTNKIFLISAEDPKQRSVKVDVNTPINPGDILTIRQSFF